LNRGDEVSDYKRVYFDVINGEKILTTYRSGIDSPIPSIEYEISIYTALSERNRTTFDVLELPFGAYANEFSTATSYRVNPTTRELEFNYDPLFTLEDYKKFKLEELSKKCTETILGRFNSTITDSAGVATVYQFSNDTEAQSNFKDGMWALENNKATSVTWTAYDVNGTVVRISLDLPKLVNVNVDRLTHQQMNVSKLRDTLQPQVKAATSKSEVESVVW
jgi:hypothetical protein